MLLYLHKIDGEWLSVSAEYYKSQARYADERKTIGVNSLDQIPNYVGISPDELVGIKATLALEQKILEFHRHC